jgi:hypothetical protein
MSFVDKEACYTARSGIYVFVGAPCCEIDVPVVELEGHVAGCVGEVPTYYYSFSLGEGCYSWDVEELTCVEVDSGQKEEGSGVSMLGYGIKDVLGGEDMGGRIGGFN